MPSTPCSGAGGWPGSLAPAGVSLPRPASPFPGRALSLLAWRGTVPWERAGGAVPGPQGCAPGASSAASGGAGLWAPLPLSGSAAPAAPCPARPPRWPSQRTIPSQKKSETFSGAISAELQPRPPLPRAAASPEARRRGWGLKGKLQGSAIRSYRMRAPANCPQLETVPLLRRLQAGSRAGQPAEGRAARRGLGGPASAWGAGAAHPTAAVRRWQSQGEEGRK